MEVKSLLVKFGSDTKAMEAGFKKADGFVTKHAEKFKKVGRTMAVAGAAIVGSLGLMVKGYVKAGDEVHKMALRTGFSTEALSELKYASEISGTSLGSLGKGIKKMASSIGEANLGLKTYTDAFKLIGIEVQELEGLNPEEQFFKMAAGIAAIEDPTQRAYAAQKLLGRAGTELLPLFAEGVEGMEALRQKARDMGIVFDQEAADKAARLNDSMTTLKDSFKGASNSIAEVLVPVVTGLVDKISGAVVKFKDWIKENPILTGTLVKVVAVLGGLATVLGPLLIMLPGITLAVKGMLGPWGLLITAIAIITTKAIAAIGTFKNFKESLEGYLDASGKKMSGFEKTWHSLTATIQKHVYGVDVVKIATEKYGEVIEEAKKKQEEYNKKAYDTITALPLFKKGLGLVKGGLDKVKSALKGAAEGESKLAEVSEEAAKKIAAANKKIISMTKTLVNEIKKATLSEYEYSKWALNKKLEDQIASIGESEANEKIRNTAIAAAREAFRLEDEALDKADAAKKAERQKELTEKMITMWSDFYAAVKAKQEEYKSASEGVTDRLNQLTMDEYTYRLTVLDKKYLAEIDYWEKMIKATGEGEGEKLKVIAAYQEEVNKVKEDAAEAEKKRIADVAAARKEALINVLECIGSILNTIGGLFQHSFDLKMDLIDKEEDRRIEAINNQYDSQIEALKALLDAEKQKSADVITAINDEYDKKRQYILDNVKNEERRIYLLAKLEDKRERKLAKARRVAEREEKRLAKALLKIDREKNKALRMASSELEKKRSKARRTAAKQEKAVALLSAIVNTAAAVAKALPNLLLAIAVGIAGAAQIAIIVSTPLPPLREGGIVMKPTAVMAGEVPEAIIPLNKLGRTDGFMPAPIAFNMRVYFYGDVNNAGDMDAISERLGSKVRRAMERGR